MGGYVAGDVGTSVFDGGLAVRRAAERPGTAAEDENDGSEDRLVIVLAADAAYGGSKLLARRDGKRTGGMQAGTPETI